MQLCLKGGPRSGANTITPPNDGGMQAAQMALGGAASAAFGGAASAELVDASIEEAIREAGELYKLCIQL